MRTAILLTAVLLLVPAAAQDDQAPLDEKLLKGAGVSTDAAGLLAYLRAQTPSEADLAKLAAAARQLGHRSFAVREQAQKTLLAAGRPSLRFLNALRSAPDIEVVRRAERAIEEIESVPHVSVMSAVVRLLAARRPDGAVEALLAYLPSVTEEVVEEAVLESLAAAGTQKDKVHPALLAALADREPARRAAAAFVHGRAAPPVVKPVLPLLRDPDPGVRLRAAEACVRGRDRAGVPVLIDLLGSPAPLGWRVEDLLCRIAGDAAPAASLGSGDEAARRRCREAWQGWWEKHGGKVDLARAALDDALLGVTLYCEYDSGPGGGRVWLAGPDGKARWEITGLQGPNDARLLRGGRVLIAERNSNRVTERDQAGKVLWEKHVTSGALSADRLPSGNTLITTWSDILEVAPDGKTVWSYAQGGGFRHGHRLRNGNVVGITAGGQVVELDAAGKHLRTVAPSQYASGAGYWATVERLSNGRYLLALGSSRKVVEVDAAGKVLWEADVPNAVFATRLRNGHTLVCNFEQRQVVELDRGGRTVATQTLTGRPFAVRRY